MISYFKGYYSITVEGLEMEKFLNHIIRNKINVYDINRISPTKIQFKVDRKDFKNFKQAYKGSKYDIKVKQKTGLPFIMKRIYKYKTMWICAILSLGILMATSLFVTDIYIQVPEGISKEAIEKELYNAGLKPGTYKKNIDRKEIRDHIMSEFNEVAYVSINVKGTNIFVTVTKKDESLKSEEDSNYCNVIASKDAIIESVVPRSGTQVTNTGEIVKQGDVLVSGADSKAVPEVWAKTFYESTKSANYVDTVEEKTGKKKNVYTISFYDKEFTIRRNINYENYEIENKEHKLTIGNYTLPIKINVSTFYETEKVTVEKDKEELKKELEDQVMKELEYMIPASARDIKVINSGHKVDGNMLEYSITVQTKENIAKVDYLTKAQAEQIIKDQANDLEEGEEPPNSNPEKRPLNDIRNGIDEQNNEENNEDDKKENEN